MAKNSKKSPYKWFVGFLVLPLLAVNSLVVWKLYSAAGQWAFAVVPYSIDEKLTQMAVLLLLNSLSLVILVLYIRFGRSS